ncbi:hypothetical protein BWQ93_18575 [Sphingopyxis sp. QXT-31]|uniref:lasso peptide biosynthesis B2 protein n=1 Tax=Sphingopyxis sp. QXT-31 TaxID=1357916 RepID=UPI0009792C37|nr:lasso peptide biosynthesis B2 protein [Sphingopyxis sp. QXT-31]AQA00238.1 hypothetical protein BWQ93_18575 [Sphingopyxis sp. QXT-31]
MTGRIALARRKLTSAWRLGGPRVLLVAEASLLLLAARIAVAVLPFRRVVRWLGRPVSPAALPPPPRRERPDDRATRVSWAVRFAARRLPVEAVCLPQAIAARIMLKRRGIAATLHLGVWRDHRAAVEADPDTPPAHAWLEASGQRVTGYPVDPALVEVAAFV